MAYQRKVQCIDKDGKPKNIKAAKLWLENPHRLDVRGLDFQPQSSELFTRSGHINLFRGWPCGDVDPTCPPLVWLEGKTDQGPLRLYKKMLRTLTYGEETDKIDWFIKRVAWIFQYPGHRPNTAVIIRSTKQGIGKSLFTNGLVRAVGEHGQTLTDGVLLKDFNSEMEAKLVLSFEEVSAGRSMEVRNLVKALITNDDITIKKKYIPEYTVHNYANVFMSSNEEAPLGITDEGDRRYFVLSVPDEAPTLTPREFEAVANWINSPNGQAEMIEAWKRVNTEGFNPGDHAPLTQAKKTLIHNSQPEWVQWFEEYGENLDDCSPGFRLRPGYVTGGYIQQEYRHHAGKFACNGRRLMGDLRDRGMALNISAAVGCSQGGKVRLGTKVVKVWAVGEDAVRESKEAIASGKLTMESLKGWITED